MPPVQPGWTIEYAEHGVFENKINDPSMGIGLGLRVIDTCAHCTVDRWISIGHRAGPRKRHG